ncbi:MAG TPA: MBL fold metallo-hydrolase [Mariprofundaceae bacterium]|nr:MBL fold metallo-hydrolase [Mariprofundaceae bacterium]
MQQTTFRQLFDYDTWTYTFLLGDPASGEAILIDPVQGKIDRDLRLLKELELELVYALDTHVHADHITGAGLLREKTGCRTGISHHAGIGCADIPLHENDIIRFGSHEIRVVETPGHTDTCLSYLFDDMAFTGDALFIRGCGRTDFQSGDAGRLYDSIHEKLFVLPDHTKVYPGHDYRGMTVSTMGEEKRFNPRLTLSRTAFVELMANLDLPDPKHMHEAIPANLACGESDA